MLLLATRFNVDIANTRVFYVGVIVLPSSAIEFIHFRRRKITA